MQLAYPPTSICVGPREPSGVLGLILGILGQGPPPAVLSLGPAPQSPRAFSDHVFSDAQSLGSVCLCVSPRGAHRAALSVEFSR